MQTYSLTYVAIALLTALCSFLGVEVAQDALQVAAGVLVAIVLGLVAFVGRHRAGGVTWYGKKTS